MSWDVQCGCEDETLAPDPTTCLGCGLRYCMWCYCDCPDCEQPPDEVGAPCACRLSRCDLEVRRRCATSQSFARRVVSTYQVALTSGPEADNAWREYDLARADLRDHDEALDQYARQLADRRTHAA